MHGGAARTAALAASGLAFAALALAPALAHRGWIISHDAWILFVRAGVIAGQWRLGHLVPVWSTAVQAGYGSPSPILYNKLFSYLSGLVLLAGAPPRAVLLVPLFAVLLLGHFGCARAVRAALGRPDLALEILAGGALLTCNYVATDWMLRGADAELAGIMVVPWLLAWGLDLVRTGRAAWTVGPLFGLLWFAHSGIALFVAPALAAAGLIALLRFGRSALLPLLRCAALAIGLFVLIAAPFLLPARPFLAYANLPAMIATMSPARTHQVFARLFHDRYWHFGDSWVGFTIQLDPVLQLALAALPFALLSRRTRWAALLLFAFSVLMLALQLRAALPVFRLPVLAYLQFTWRLVGPLSVALAIGGAVAIAAVPRAGLRLGCIALAALAIGLDLPKPPSRDTVWLPDAKLRDMERAVVWDLNLTDPREYLPRTNLPGDPDTRTLLAQIGREAVCTARAADRTGGERARLRFLPGGCAPGRTMALPVFLAPGMRVTQDGVTLAMRRTCTDPRIRVVPRDASPVVVVPPGWWSAIRAGFAGGDAPWRSPCPAR